MAYLPSDPDAEPRRQRRGKKGTPPPATRATPAHIVEQRTLQVIGLLTAGQRTAQVKRSVATLQRREQMDRERAKAAGEPPIGVIWGDSPIPTRTIDRYIQKAKEQLRTDARALPRSADYVLGMQWSRINDLYNAARQAGRFSVCVDLIEIVNSMFGLNAAIRMQFGEAPEGGDLSHLPTARLTRAQAKDALSELLHGLQRSGEQLLASGSSSEPGRPSPVEVFPTGELGEASQVVEELDIQHPPHSNGSSNGSGNGHKPQLPPGMTWGPSK